MKNEKLIVGIASLLKVDKDVVVKSLENEAGDDGIIKEFYNKNNVFTLEDVAKLKTNSKAEAISDLEKATEFPAPIYNRVKGLAFEKAEKEVAKKYGVEAWSNFEDLVSKVASKGKGGDDEKDKQIDLLKKSLLSKEEEIANKVKEVESKYTSDFINRDFSLAVSSIKLEGEDEAVANQSKLLAGAFKSNFNLTYKEGKTIVLDAENKILVDKLGDPMPVADVFKSFAVKHGAKLKEEAAGGRGDGSSKGSQNNNLKGKTFVEALAAKGVKPNTDEADKLFSEWRAANIQKP